MTGNLSRRMVDFRFSYVDIMVRSARRLDGTGRTGYIYNWKNGHIQMRNHAETGTVTGVSIGISRCRGEIFYKGTFKTPSGNGKVFTGGRSPSCKA